jgi:hypothetical protein
VVFDRVVENMEKDLVQVALWLGSQKTSTITQEVQFEVEMTLQELIEAMKRTQEQQAQNPEASECKGGGCQGKLLASSSELKLLRSHQLRVNRVTRLLGRAEARGELNPQVTERLRSLSDFQEEILEMAREMTKR